MKKTISIALNTFREAVRDRILYNLLIFSLILIGGSILLGSLTIGEQRKIIVDVGIASMELFGVLIAIFLGIGLVSKEIDRRTIYTIVSKPIRRWQFLLGKFLGLEITIAVNILVMSIALSAVLAAAGVRFTGDLSLVILFIFLELTLLTAVALLFSTFTTTTLSAIFTLGLFVAGHLTGDLKQLAGNSQSPVVGSILNAVYFSLPNFERFNLKPWATYPGSLPSNLLLPTAAYGIVYVILLFNLSVIIFERRDFR